jgi:hypothetical protein
LAGLVGAPAVQAAPPCALPAANELGPLDPPPEPSWALQEKWIWERTLAGEMADFNQLYCQKLDPKADDPAWRDPAKPGRVGERFLLDALAKKPFAEAIPARGLRIVGAWFPDPLDLSGVEIVRQLWLAGSRLDKPVSFSFARLENSLSLEGSTFTGDVDLNGAKVEGMLVANGSTLRAAWTCTASTSG